MPLLLLKDLPRYECLLEGAKEFPAMDPSACEVFLHLLRTGDEVFAATSRNFARHNISEGRFGVLMLLWSSGRKRTDSDGAVAEGPCGRTLRTPAELADAAGVTRATMTGLIDTLERDGFVVREQQAEDRRMMTVSLTPKADAFLRELLPGHFETMARLMEPLNETERKLLVTLLNKILLHATNLASATPDPSAPAPTDAAVVR